MLACASSAPLVIQVGDYARWTASFCLMKKATNQNGFGFLGYYTALEQATEADVRAAIRRACATV